MVLLILRGVFVVLATAVAMLYILGAQEGLEADVSYVILLVLGTLGVSAIVIAVDVYTPRKKLSAVSGVFLGLGAGLLAAFALSFVVDLVGIVLLPEISDLADKSPEELQRIKERLREEDMRKLAYLNLLKGVKVIIGLITSYIGITLVLQTKDDFRFVIPYVEFTKQIRGNRPLVVDTSVIIDGRIADIVETKVLQGAVIVPRFVLEELQTVADLPDKLKRNRGRRGLDILQKLQNSRLIDVHIDESEPEGANVDQKLIALAMEMNARLMTNDFNLKKVAELRGVDIINLNDLVGALRPVVLPGEHMSVVIQKPGEGGSQGVGYLEDGTMVVVEHARNRIGQEVEFTVTSNYQTSAGRMIFGQAIDGQGGGARPVSEPAGQSQPSARQDEPEEDRGHDESARPASDAQRAAPPRRSGPSARNPRRSR